MAFTDALSLAIKDGLTAAKNILTFSNGTQQAYGVAVVDTTGNMIDPAVKTGAVSLTITPTVQVSTYSPNNVVGGKLSIANAVRVSGGSGIIQTVSVHKKSAQSSPVDIYFFHTDPANSTFTDKAALALNVADLPYLIGVAHCTDQIDNGTPKTAQAPSVSLPFKLATGTTLFAVPVIRGTDVYASTSDVIINVGILQN